MRLWEIMVNQQMVHIRSEIAMDNALVGKNHHSFGNLDGVRELHLEINRLGRLSSGATLNMR